MNTVGVVWVCGKCGQFILFHNVAFVFLTTLKQHCMAFVCIIIH